MSFFSTAKTKRRTYLSPDPYLKSMAYTEMLRAFSAQVNTRVLAVRVVATVLLNHYLGHLAHISLFLVGVGKSSQQALGMAE